MGSGDLFERTLLRDAAAGDAFKLSPPHNGDCVPSLGRVRVSGPVPPHIQACRQS